MAFIIDIWGAGLLGAGLPGMGLLGAGGGVGGMSRDQETFRRFLDLRGVMERVGFRIDLGRVVGEAGIVGKAGFVGKAGIIGKAGVVGKAGIVGGL